MSQRKETEQAGEGLLQIIRKWSTEKSRVPEVSPDSSRLTHESSLPRKDVLIVEKASGLNYEELLNSLLSILHIHQCSFLVT